MFAESHETSAPSPPEAVVGRPRLHCEGDERGTPASPDQQRPRRPWQRIEPARVPCQTRPPRPQVGRRVGRCRRAGPAAHEDEQLDGHFHQRHARACRQFDADHVLCQVGELLAEGPPVIGQRLPPGSGGPRRFARHHEPIVSTDLTGGLTRDLTSNLTPAFLDRSSWEMLPVAPSHPRRGRHPGV